jgi:hypothetical protein
MGTGISRAGVALAALTLGLAGCGGSGTSAGGGSHKAVAASGSTAVVGGSTTRAAGSGTGSTFSWLRAQPPPAGWKVVTISSGAKLTYPPGWHRQHSDPGTATAVLQNAGGSYLGYVNLTPRQGAETLANWSSFRVEHNTEEGDRHVKRLAAAAGLRFLTGHGSCVQDSYTTTIGAAFTEIACLVAGHRGEWVIVAAAPPNEWGHESTTLEREIEAVRT